MPSIVGKYKHYKNENIDEYFTAVGVPYMARKMIGMSSPLMTISTDGDEWCIKYTSMIRTVETSFRLGVEYDETMPQQTLKSVTTLENEELVTNTVIPETGAKTWRRYTFTDDECVVTLSHESVKTPGKRYFRRVKDE